jgi:hypothetical protein
MDQAVPLGRATALEQQAMAANKGLVAGSFLDNFIPIGLGRSSGGATGVRAPIP